MAVLSSLPPEVILSIADHLEYRNDVLHLAKACKGFYRMLESYLLRDVDFLVKMKGVLSEALREKFITGPNARESIKKIRSFTLGSERTFKVFDDNDENDEEDIARSYETCNELLEAFPTHSVETFRCELQHLAFNLRDVDKFIRTQRESLFEVEARFGHPHTNGGIESSFFSQSLMTLDHLQTLRLCCSSQGVWSTEMADLVRLVASKNRLEHLHLEGMFDLEFRQMNDYQRSSPVPEPTIQLKSLIIDNCDVEMIVHGFRPKLLPRLKKLLVRCNNSNDMVFAHSFVSMLSGLEEIALEANPLQTWSMGLYPQIPLKHLFENHRQTLRWFYLNLGCLAYDVSAEDYMMCERNLQLRLPECQQLEEVCFEQRFSRREGGERAILPIHDNVKVIYLSVTKNDFGGIPVLGDLMNCLQPYATGKTTPPKLSMVVFVRESGDQAIAYRVNWTKLEDYDFYSCSLEEIERPVLDTMRELGYPFHEDLKILKHIRYQEGAGERPINGLSLLDY